MTTWFSPNIKIQGSWSQTIRTLASNLCRKRFAVEESFQWSDWNPTFDWGGMTVTDFILSRARYLPLNKKTDISMYFTFTAGGALATTIKIQLPVTTPDTGLQIGIYSLDTGGISLLRRVRVISGANELLLDTTGINPGANLIAIQITLEIN